MMRLILITAALLAGLAGAAQAEILQKGITTDNLPEKYRAAASSLDFDSSLLKVECSQDVKKSCQFTASGKVGVLATADKDKTDVKDMILILGKGTNSTSYLISLGVMIAMLNPDASQSSRGEILNNTLVASMKADGEEKSFVRNGIEYKASSSPLTGIFFVITPE